MSFLPIRYSADRHLNELKQTLRQDLCHFEGNAQAIRMAHHLLKLNLTYAQIGCVLKYTRPAYWQGATPKEFSYLMKNQVITGLKLNLLRKYKRNLQ